MNQNDNQSTQAGNTADPHLSQTRVDQARFVELADRYQILEELAQGGMGLVYKARQVHLAKICAIKMLRLVTPSDDVLIKRFKREAQALSKLNHPNLITAFDFGVLQSGEPYLVMEYVEGESLAEVIDKRRGLPLKEALPIFIQICKGMAYAHGQGIVHRDLKPSNVMLVQRDGAEPVVRIIDFGIARLDNSEVGVTADLTRTGDIFGSPLYMSPEQAHGHVVDRRCDIYSLGVLMFQTLSGSPPFGGMTALDTILQHLNDPVPRLKDSAGKPVLPVVQACLEKCMAKQPEARFQTMTELQQELETIAKILESPFARVAAEHALPFKTKGNREIWFLAIAAIVAIGITVVMATVFWPSSSQKITRSYLASKEPDEIGTIGGTKVVEALIPKTDEIARSKICLDTENDYINLSSLDVTDDQLSEFKNRKGVRIEAVNLSGNPIEGSGLQYLVDEKIKRLVLDRTKISDNAMQIVAAMPKLVELSINKTGITDEGLKLLPSQLKRLYAGHCKITDAGVRTIIHRLTHLEDLSLEDDSEISDKELANLSSMPRLTGLMLNGTQVSDETVIHFAKSRRLTRLFLGQTQVTDKSALALANLDLVTLDLSGTEVTEKGAMALVRCQSIEVLNLRGCPHISDNCKARLRVLLKPASVN